MYSMCTQIDLYILFYIHEKYASLIIKTYEKIISSI